MNEQPIFGLRVSPLPLLPFAFYRRGTFQRRSSKTRARARARWAPEWRLDEDTRVHARLTRVRLNISVAIYTSKSSTPR